MGGRGQDFVHAARGLEPTVSFLDDRTYFTIRNQIIAPGITVDQADFELTDSKETADELVSSRRLQHQSTRLLRLSLSVDLKELSRRCALAVIEDPRNIDGLSVHTEGADLLLEASVDESVATTTAILMPSTDGRLRMVFDDERWFGAMNLRSLPGEIFQVATSLVNSTQLPGFEIELISPTEICVNILEPAIWALFPAFGWKLPLYRNLDVRNARIESNDRLCIHAVSELTPRRFQLQTQATEREQLASVRTLARQDAIKSIPSKTYMLTDADFSTAFRFLTQSLPESPPAALLERVLWASLADPVFHDEGLLYLDTELAARPTSIPGLLVRAHLRLQNQEVLGAAEDFSEVAQRLSGTRAVAHASRQAALALAECDPAASLLLLRRAFEIAPENMLTRLDLAQALAGQDEHRSAVEILDKLAKDPMVPVAFRATALIQAGEWMSFELNDHGSAEANYEMALQLIPDHPEALLGLSQVLQSRGDLQRAALILERLLASAEDAHDDERASTLCMFLGDLWARSDVDAALLRYRRAVELDPQNESAQLRIDDLDISTDLQNVLPEFLSVVASAHQAPSASVLPTRPAPPSSDRADPGVAPSFLSLAGQSHSSSPPPDSNSGTPKSTPVDHLESSAVGLPDPAELEEAVSIATPTAASPGRFETLIDIAESKMKTLIQDSEASDNSLESGYADEVFAEIYELLEKIIIEGTHQDQVRSYSRLRNQCEETQSLNLYSKLLEHRVSETKNIEDLLTAHLEHGEWLEFHMLDAPLSESAYRAALSLDGASETARKRLQHLLVAQDRFEDLLDDLGSHVLAERLQYLLGQGLTESERALQAARVFATTISSSARGQFWLSTSAQLKRVEDRCEALFEASHFEDVSKKEVMDILTQIDAGSSVKARASLLRTCLSLEEDHVRRVELRMALGECMANFESELPEVVKEVLPEAEASDSQAFEDEEDSNIDITRDLRNETATRHLSKLISAAQVDKLEQRALRLLEDNKRSRAMGSALIVQLLKENHQLPSVRQPRLKKNLEEGLLVDVISAGELNSPLGILLRCTAKGVGTILPAIPDETKIEMDENGSEIELTEVLQRTRKVLGVDFKIFVDLESMNSVNTMTGQAPGVSISAAILKEATETELLFLIAREVLFIRLGGLLYTHESGAPENLSNWIEVLYHLLDHDVLDRIPYEYASFVETLRASLTDVQQVQLQIIRSDYTLDEVLNNLSAWPKMARRICNRVAFLMTAKLGVVASTLADDGGSELEDLLDFMLSDAFANTVEALISH